MKTIYSYVSPALFIFAALFCFPARLAASEHRLEANIYYDYLKPNDAYGSYKSMVLDYYVMPKDKGYSYYFETGADSRNTGDAMSFLAGGYKDWSPWFYTFSALSYGTDSSYIPNCRFDTDFNFKILKNKNLVLTSGITGIKFYDVHTDNIFSLCATAYLDKFIFSYRSLRNDNSPGNVIAYSNLFSISYGAENKAWTYLTAFWGAEGYIATDISSDSLVQSKAQSIELKHRKWLKNGYGIIAGLGYLKHESDYEKYSLILGGFKEF